MSPPLILLLLLLLLLLLFFPPPAVFPSPWKSGPLPPQKLVCPPPPPSIPLPLSTPTRDHSGTEEELGAVVCLVRRRPSRIPTQRPLMCSRPARIARPAVAKTATAMKMNPVECSWRSSLFPTMFAKLLRQSVRPEGTRHESKHLDMGGGASHKHVVDSTNKHVADPTKHVGGFKHMW